MTYRQNLKITTAIFAAAMATASAPALAATCTWQGGAGSFTDPLGWSCGSVPGASDYVRIDGGSGIASLVTLLNANVLIGTMLIDSNDALSLNSAYLGFNGGLLTDNGQITIANASRLYANSGPLNFAGTGSILLDDSANYAQLGGNNLVYTFGSGFTVHGSGQLGYDSSFLVNNGTVSADVAGRTLSIDTTYGSGGPQGAGVGTGGNAGILNTSILQAVNGGTLRLEGGYYENSGIIEALAGSTVSFGNDVRIVGGTLSSTGTGTISALNGNQYLSGMTLLTGSQLNLNNDYVNLDTRLTNNGTITIANASRLTGEGGTGSVTIDGTGTILLDASSNYAQLGGNNVTLILGSGQTVHGSGQIGYDSSQVSNAGLISADAGTITLDPLYGSNGPGAGAGLGPSLDAGFFNSGTMQATGVGSMLALQSGDYANSGTIRAINNGIVGFGNDVRITGGTITSNSGGALQAINGNQYFGGVILSSGSALSLDNDYLNINGTLTNNGVITIANASRLTGENGTGVATLSGTGTIILDSSSNYAQLGGNSVAFLIGSGQVVRGSGQVGYDSSLITNNGLISADTGTITLDPSYGSGGPGVGNGFGPNHDAGFYNTGILQATGAGNMLAFNSGDYANGGTIRAVNGAIVDFGNDVRINGGTITSNSGGALQAIDDNQYFGGVTLSTGSALSLSNDYLNINGSLTNNGTITIANASRLTGENGTGTATLNGTGTIILDSSSNYAQLGGNNVSFIIGSGQVVRGSGQVGYDSSLITNNGLISADTGTIALDAIYGSAGPTAGTGVGPSHNAGFYNAGTLQVTGAGHVLSFASGFYDNSAGTIQALSGGLVDFGNDVRINGGSILASSGGSYQAIDDNQYFSGVTLGSGAALFLSNDYLNINGSITNNGTITVSNASLLRGEGGTGTATLDGTGTVILDNSLNYAQVGGNGVTFVIGSGETVRGAGSIGGDGGFVVNNGLISADTGTGITLDPAYGSAGPGAGNGVGAALGSGFYNSGTIQANGAAINLSSGLYENSASGSFSALGSAFTMNGDANLANLGAGGVLSLGSYAASGGGVLSLRSSAADAITAIGTAGTGTDTVVTLSGVGSTLNVIGWGSGLPTTIDASLSHVGQTGELDLLANRSFTAIANGGAFSNAGIVQLGGGSFVDTSYTNSGRTFGYGSIGAIGNSGIVEAKGGTLSTGRITGTSGTIQSDSGATLDLSAALGNSSAGYLVNNGALALGGNSITVTSDYQNASFGSGNSFAAHANVSGTGQILAASATMDLSATGLNGAGTVLDVGNVRIGGSTDTTLTITNNGTLTTLRGAVQNSNAPGISLSDPDFVIGANGGSASVTIGFSGLTAGSLAGQSLSVVNDFDNVANATIALEGNVYQVAVAAMLPSSITLNASRVGGSSGSSSFTIQNVAPDTGGFTESLQSVASADAGFLLNGASPVSTAALGAGASQSVALTHSTSVAGIFNGVVSVANTSLAQSGSGLADLALGTQSIAVQAKVYAPAVASLGATTLDLGVVRQGSSNLTGGIAITNASTGSLTDSLITSVGSAPSGISVSTPGALASGQTGTASFTLSAANAGVYSGSATLDFASHDADLADMALASQSVAVTGTVTQVAVAEIFKNAGIGTLTGSGSNYVLDLGTLSGSGSTATELGVLNAILSSAYSEALGGSFTLSGNSAFAFDGAPISDLAGGMSDLGNLLTFDYSGLANGNYSALLTFNDFSHYAGLSDLALGPVQISIKASVIDGSGPAPGVPEPATWLQMLLGFGVAAISLRRRTHGKRFLNAVRANRP